jgi:sulfate transport system ATP-binding protein
LLPTQGSIHFNGADVSRMAPNQRAKVGMAYVPQGREIFPNLSVTDNLRMGWVKRGRASAHDLDTLLDNFPRLKPLLDRMGGSLSGGEQQLLALARALAGDPQLLLLDEPFGALDAKVRKELRRWLRQLHDELHVTSIFVTHDQEEALEVSDRVVLMNKGKVEQHGAPDEVYNHPASPFVYGFLGNVNLFHGRVHEGVLDAGGASLAVPDHAQTVDAKAVGYVRPHELDIDRYSPGAEGIAARLKRAYAIGPLAQLELEREDNGGLIEAALPSERFIALQLKEGDTVLVKPRKVRVFFDQAA